MWWRKPSMIHIINFCLTFAGIWISEWHNIFEEATNRKSSRTSWDRWSLLDMKMVSGFANTIVLDLIFIYWRCGLDFVIHKCLVIHEIWLRWGTQLSDKKRDFWVWDWLSTSLWDECEARWIHHDLEWEAMWIHDFNYQTTWSGTEVYNSLAEALFYRTYLH
jgi:hypothetical protein